ncbi:hypothetical protein [Blastococcus haudaquaticus]|uniref:Uncharacterized protein n=1 Tax=Blastococcus haudaquaticus TaxID=1938745 RepID=A0A286GGW5_9ACTN|nr:hypothetical protein [Blastococcus haudaquaticus]SOD94244.1 hypothetical protein SAMN06272739_0660 [Blastococcus haudaquaticus]
MTEDANDAWPYYALDFPGLSRDDAERILAWVRQQGPALSSLLDGEGVEPGSIVEPDWWYVRYLDKCAVRSLKKASEIALATGQLTDAETDALTSGVEDFTEWLQQAAGTEDDCPDD